MWKHFFLSRELSLNACTKLSKHEPFSRWIHEISLRQIRLFLTFTQGIQISLVSKIKANYVCNANLTLGNGMAVLRKTRRRKPFLTDSKILSLSLHVFVYLWVMNYFQKTVFCSHRVFPSFLICTFDKTWGKTSSCIQKA